MENKTALNKRHVLAFLLMLVYIASVALFLSFAGSLAKTEAVDPFGSGRDGAGTIETNEAGQTYGSISNDIYNPSANPDLIAVLATNGEAGYVYYSEFYDLIKDERRMPSDESIEKQQQKSDAYSKAYLEAASEYFGYEFNSLDEVFNAVESATQSRSSTEENISQILMERVREKIGAHLTVYLSDGVTPVGEFILDTM